MEQKELIHLTIPEVTERQKRFGKLRQWFKKVGDRLLVDAGVDYQPNIGLDIFNAADSSSAGEEHANSADANAIVETTVLDSATPSISEPNTPHSLDRTPRQNIEHNRWEQERLAQVIDMAPHRQARQQEQAFLADPLSAPVPASMAGPEQTHDQLTRDMYGPFQGKHVVGQ